MTGDGPSSPGPTGADRSPDVVWHQGSVSAAQRHAVTGGPGAVVWLTGLSGSGKSSVAVAMEAALLEAGRAAYVLDGDNLRHGLNGDLGFSAAERSENVRRTAEVAVLFADAGVVALVPLISPYRADRERARARAVSAGATFVEVHLDVALATCEERDPKGLYARARAGELTGMTGIDDPYEPPDRPEVVLGVADGSPEEMARVVLDRLG